jgi:hypothetical protein
MAVEPISALRFKPTLAQFILSRYHAACVAGLLANRSVCLERSLRLLLKPKA